jgi:hypothetical protein
LAAALWTLLLVVAVGGSMAGAEDGAEPTTLVSRVGAEGAGGDGNSAEPSISADGRYVAFASGAENLSSEDTAFGDVFVRDLVAGTTTLVSRASGPAGAVADFESSAASISADGRHVAF